MGVNLGHLGFLSALEDGDLDAVIDALADGGFSVDERTMVRAVITSPGTTAVTLDALNDVIVEKQRVGRSIRLRVTIGGEPVVSWAADGVIVATSTGSTAYSFSAGGPVVSPRLECLLVTPVAPHGMFGRTMVLPPDEEVAVDLATDSDPAALSPDGGTGVDLAPGSNIAVRLGDRVARLAHIEPSPFWRLVREKFGLRAEGD
jgi:NAD+ kinase